MTYDVRLTDLGEDAAEEAEVSTWLVAEGDVVEEGDDLVEMTTDKAAFNVPSPKAGTVRELSVDEGGLVSVGDVLCVLDVTD